MINANVWLDPGLCSNYGIFAQHVMDEHINARLVCVPHPFSRRHVSITHAGNCPEDRAVERRLHLAQSSRANWTRRWIESCSVVMRIMCKLLLCLNNIGVAKSEDGYEEASSFLHPHLPVWTPSSRSVLNQMWAFQVCVIIKLLNFSKDDLHSFSSPSPVRWALSSCSVNASCSATLPFSPSIIVPSRCDYKQSLQPASRLQEGPVTISSLHLQVCSIILLLGGV